MPNECKAPMMQFTLDFAFFLALWAAAARCERPCNCYFSKLVFGKFCFSLLLKWRSSRNSLWTAEGQTIFFFSFCVCFCSFSFLSLFSRTTEQCLQLYFFPPLSSRSRWMREAMQLHFRCNFLTKASVAYWAHRPIGLLCNYLDLSYFYLLSQVSSDCMAHIPYSALYNLLSVIPGF